MTLLKYKTEYFDVYDSNCNKKGYKVLRGKALKKGEYHLVVEVITITKDGKILVTKRHPNKNYPLHYEFTGGSVLAGETPLIGAVRELEEETGIYTADVNLIFLGTVVYKETIYMDYLNIIDAELPISLQDGETVAYKYIDQDNFLNFCKKYKFVPSAIKRFELYNEKIVELRKNS